MNNKTLAWIVAGGVGAALLALLLFVTSTTVNLPSGMMTGSFDSSSAVQMMRSGEQYADMMFAGDEVALREESYQVVVPPEEPSAGVTAAEVDQKIIKTGSLDLEVGDVGEVSAKITASATGRGGFVQDSDVSEREDGTHFGNVTVRVPSEQFEAAMTEIKTFAATVRTESSQGQDVTEQYTDLEAQLRNAKAQEEEYLQILERATTVEEILMVQSYLSSVRYTIESLEGRLQYLENRTSYSTITVSLSEEPTIRIPTKDFNLFSTLKEAFQALVAIAQNLANAIVWLVVVGGGIVVPVGLLAWLVIKLIVKLRR